MNTLAMTLETNRHMNCAKVSWIVVCLTNIHYLCSSTDMPVGTNIVSAAFLYDGKFSLVLDLKSATKPFNALLACTCPLLTRWRN